MCQFNKPTLQTTNSNSQEGRFLLKAGNQTNTKKQPVMAINCMNTVAAVMRSIKPTQNGLIEAISPIVFAAIFLAFFYQF